MKDRYLFRGKRTENGEWVYGCVLQADNWSDISVIYNYDGSMYEPPLFDFDSYEVIPETVGQYTGLTDKNGKRIFENGYIIIDNKTYKVTFNNAEYILTNIFNCDTITLKNNSIRGVFVDEI